MFRRSSSVRLFSAFGIPVGVDAGWFVVLFLMIYLWSGPFRTTLHSSDLVAYLTTVASVLLLFGSIIVHEFGHAYAARRAGIGVTGIELHLFGGLTRMTRDPETAGEDFTVAAAGPLATIAVLLVFLALDAAILGPHRLYDAIALRHSVNVTPVLLALSWLIPLNALLLAFNLLPAFPLDGGRIARSAVWRFTGDKGRATLVAGHLGQGLAIVMVAAGVWWLAAAHSLLGLYTLLLAWMLWGAARGATAEAALDARVADVRVADIMDAQPVFIPADVTADEALEAFFWRYRWSWFPVVSDEGRFAGIARQEVSEAAAQNGEGWVRIGSLVESGGPSAWRVGAERPITDLLGSESLRALGAIMVVDGDGVLRGVVTVEQVRRAMSAALA